MIDQYPLGELSAEQFLRDYWQKKPLLIRNAIPDFEPPVSADELAGLACEQEVESRLIRFDPASDHWSLEHGPFDESTFANLPPRHWTLLVQGVDHWIPDAADLLAQFSFIPNWRVDDLMISYAVTGGGVGPHYDNYDVFLLQAAGHRRWELGGLCDEHSPRRDDAPVMILPQWQPEQSYELGPGDMLYLPPQVAHNGVALDDECVTCSIGFRAPAHNELLRSFSDHIGEQLGRETRYTDPDLSLQENPGEITAAALDKVQAILEHYLQDRTRLTQWFGRYMTDPKYPELEEPGDDINADELGSWLAEGGVLVRNEGARFAYVEHGPGPDALDLFVDGRAYTAHGDTATIARALCASRTLELAEQADSLSDETLNLLATLISSGALYCAED